jgi:hypothetical protein
MSLTDSVREQVDARLKELEPLVEEYERLQQVVQVLDGQAGQPSGARATPRRALRTHVTTRRGQSRRAEEALKLVAGKPGITVAEAAEAMGIGTTYLYRLLPRLEREGRVRTEGRGYRLA